MVGSFYDPELDEGCAFEELISFHGGLGGPQTRAFILHPASLPVPEGPILGAAAVHGILLGWREHLTDTRRSGVIYAIFTAVGVVALVLAIATIVSVLRNPRVSGGEKAVWVVCAVIFPFLGAITYFTVRRNW